MDGNREASIHPGYTEIVREVVATVAVESTWHSDESHRYHTLFKVLSKSRVDTSLYENAQGLSWFPYSDPAVAINYDTQGFPDLHDDSTMRWEYKAGDTLRDVFILQIDRTPNFREWHMTGIRCKYLSQTDAPFSYPQSMAAFRRYAVSTHLLTGHAVKLGPVFNLIPGEPAFLLTARPEGAFWHFDLIEGFGDCPAGCTEHKASDYRVDSLGAVTLVSQQLFYTPCYPPIGILRPGSPAQAPSNVRGCYSADGREMETNHPPARTPVRIFPR